MNEETDIGPHPLSPNNRRELVCISPERLAALEAAERDVARLRAERDNVSAYFAIRVLRDALIAYMEPAGDTPDDLRRKAKSALRFAQKALPLEHDAALSPDGAP